MPIESISLNLKISVDEMEKYYRGSAQQIIAVAEDGRRVQFPASAVRRFVTRDGVRGRFLLLVDEHGKLVEMRRAPVASG